MSAALTRPTRRISIALMVSVALTSVITTVLGAFAVLFYNAESTQRRDDFHRSLRVDADQLALALALPAWGYDNPQIVATMKTGFNSDEVVGIAVDVFEHFIDISTPERFVVMRAPGGALAQTSTLPSDPTLTVERRPIVASGKRIGVVALYGSEQPLLKELRRRRLAIIAGIMILDLTLVASVYLLLWFLMIKPLKEVVQFAAAVSAGVGATPAERKAWFFGELDALNESVHDMIALLENRFQAMRASEGRLKVAARAASIGIWDWNVQANQLVWDEQMLRIFKIERDDFGGTHESWIAAVHEEDRAVIGHAIAAALRGEREYEAEFRITRPDGAIRYIHADSLTMRDTQGVAVRMVGVNYDITESKHAEQELLRHRHNLEERVDERTAALSVAVAQAQAANRAKTVFLATMSHELRTPLNSVIGFSRMMADSRTMLPEEKRNLAIIHRSGQHLLTIINDILELSKIEAGRLQVQIEPLDLNALLREVVDMVSARAAMSGISLALEREAVPPAVLVDGVKLRQVLLNLMSNAVKFVERGGVTLEVRCTPGDGDACELAFAVRDTGVGIALQDQQRIFEPFIQVQGERAVEGTGLGLTISRDFVELLGGTLVLKSAPGTGSVFSFRIPARVSTFAPAPTAHVMQALPPELAGQRMLVVDDNEDGRALLCGLLRAIGFSPEEAGDGHAALAAIAAEPFDLVFMDWRMPGMDGASVIRAVRADACLRQPRIVMVTASAFEDERREALAAGADDFLAKPIEQDGLYRIVERLVGVTLMRCEDANAEPPAPPASPDLARLPPDMRVALGVVLRGLNMARVAELLASAGEWPDVVCSIEHMLSQHRYRELCALLDATDLGAATS